MTAEPIAGRVAALEAAFREIAATRMQGVPVRNPRLAVQAVGFLPADDGMALGVLVTPWFMNLVRLPLTAEAAPSIPPVGGKQAHTLAGQAFEFIGAHEAAIGAYASCSLFSPMFEFADQAAAVATAAEVLRLLRPAPPPAPEPVPPRRGFLFGRSAAGAPR